MSNVAITELLKQLHGTLADTGSITEADRELLRQLAADIQALLAQPDAAAGPRHESVAGRISAAVMRLEVTHPDVTAVLSSVGKALGDMGI
jgi:hypothetical protein